MAETVRRVSQSTTFVINPTQGLDLSSNNNQQFVLTAAETRSRRRKSGIKVHNPLEISEGSISEPLVGMDNPTFTIRDEQQRKISTGIRPTLPTIASGLALETMDTAADFYSAGKVMNHKDTEKLTHPTSQNEPSLTSGVRSRKISREAAPHIDNYRNMLHRQASRPTLEELHDSNVNQDKPIEYENNENKMDKKDKFGWIEGVLIRNMLSIWGVMLFLRISWVVAVAGIWQCLIIIAISTFITLVTAMSMSAIATNGEIGGGGTYYVMSRILGPEFGGSIGLIFALANAINASLNVVGFVQTVQDAMWNYGGYIIVDGGLNDTRILGSILLILVWALCGAGAKYEAKTQIILLAVLMVALANFLIGSILGPHGSEEKIGRGFLGFKADLFAENWKPGYAIINGQMQSFFSVFSVFFPAAIGILAGANVSGDLRNPNSAIPKGTILAIIITSISYAIVAIICAGTTEREATGCVEGIINSTCVTENNKYGSYYDYQLMTLISAYGPLNYAGCFAATLSSALASFISCPKLMQVIGDDKLYPYWLVGFFAKGYGKSNEPLRAYAFTFLLALVFILIANLDTVALLISNFFLATFALMNYSTFHVSLVKPVGWRPTFKYYNMWLSLFVAALCVVAMFLISWPVALITIAIVLGFYLAVWYRHPNVNWGSSSQAMNYREALTSMQQLAYTEEHVKNYRPQILALTGSPGSRPALIDFAYLICKQNSMLICSQIEKNQMTSKNRATQLQKAYKYLRMHKIKGFCSLIDNVEMQQGVAAMLEVAGVGKMKPNILLMGFKNDWRTCDKPALDQYFATIHAGFNMVVGVAILRLSEGLDYSGFLGDIILDSEGDKEKNPIDKNQEELHHSDSTNTITSSDSGVISTPDAASSNVRFELSSSSVCVDERTTVNNKTMQEININNSRLVKKKSRKISNPDLRDSNGNPLPKTILNKITIFQKKKKETIDVWWLYDDGGLTLLLPHIINTRSNWSSCKLRVICTSTGQEALEKEHEGMAALLAKFRIDYSDLVVISDPSSRPPSEFTSTWFDGLIRHFIRREVVLGQNVLEEELITFRDKTNRHLRLRELLIDHSSDSSLVVMTLPMPRKGGVSAPLYMAWLEALTANMPPFLLVRGNQSSVLTFYS